MCYLKLLTCERDGCRQPNKGDIVLKTGRIPARMHGVFGGHDSDLSRLDNVLVVGTKNDFERTASIRAMSSSQDPVGSDDGGTAEPRIINN